MNPYLFDPVDCDLRAFILANQTRPAREIEANALRFWRLPRGEPDIHSNKKGNVHFSSNPLQNKREGSEQMGTAVLRPLELLGAVGVSRAARWDLLSALRCCDSELWMRAAPLGEGLAIHTRVSLELCYRD